MRLYLLLIIHKKSFMDRLKSYFNEYFSDATEPAATNLSLIVVSILILDIFRSGILFVYDIKYRCGVSKDVLKSQKSKLAYIDRINKNK